MPVGLTAPVSLAPVAGVRVATAALGGRGKPRHDHTQLEIAPRAPCARRRSPATRSAPRR